MMSNQNRSKMFLPVFAIINKFSINKLYDSSCNNCNWLLPFIPYSHPLMYSMQ